MSRNLIRILVAVVVLNSIAVASTLLWSNTASSTEGQVFEGQVFEGQVFLARFHFDHASANVTAPPAREYTPAILTPADYQRIFASVTVPWDGAHAPAIPTMADFDRVFASVSVARREDTPPNRERLRNIGWKRILGSS